MSSKSKEKSSSIEKDYMVKSKVSRVFNTSENVSKRYRDRSRSVSSERGYRSRKDESRDYRSREDKSRHRKRSRSYDKYDRSPRRRRSDSRDRKSRRIDEKLERRKDKDYEKKNKNDHVNEDEKRDEPKRGDEDEDVAKYWASKKAKTSLKSVVDENLMTKTGGAYIPPARLRMMQDKITDKSSIKYQRIAWEALKKSLKGLINKVTVSSVHDICEELFQENIVRGRGILVKSIMQAQASSMIFTNIYAAVAAVVNSKFPQVGLLLLNRLIQQFKRGFKRNNKQSCISSSSFIAHLYNQKMVNEVVVFEILILLLERPTNDSVEVVIGLLKQSGKKLSEDNVTATMDIFDSLKNILNEAIIDKRVAYMIEVMFMIRKDGFKDFPTVIPELELMEDEDQFTHEIALDDEVNVEDRLNVFEFDPNYEENESKYKAIKDEIFGEDSNEENDDDDDDGSGEESGGEGENGEEGTGEMISDRTETNLITLRRTIYLTIQSSLDYEECAHKLLKMQLKPGQEAELCYMILDCSAQERTYIPFYGLLAQRFCNLDNKYVGPYETIFKEQYDTAHRLETNKLRNVSKFFAHLLYTDAISWEVLQCIKLNEDDTTSSSRIFIKNLFQELSEFMGLAKLNQRLKDQTLQAAFAEIFPKSNPRDTRFAINFFTSIGLGGLTDELRDHLKVMIAQQKAAAPTKAKSPSPSSSSSSDSSSSDSDSDSD